MAIDPICKMIVDEETSLSSEQGGQTYYFCSEHCKSKFSNQHSVATKGQPAESAQSCCDHGEQPDHQSHAVDAHATKTRPNSVSSSAAYILSDVPRRRKRQTR